MDNLGRLRANAEANTGDPQNYKHTATNDSVTFKSARKTRPSSITERSIHASMIFGFQPRRSAESEWRSPVGYVPSANAAPPTDLLSDLSSYAVCAGLRRS